MGRWLAFAQLAAAAVVDVGVPAGYVRVRIDIAGVLHELDVARDASPADVAALARTFCDGRRELIAEAVGGIADWAVATGCPELVAAAAARELAPDLAFTDASVFVATPEAVAWRPIRSMRRGARVMRPLHPEAVRPGRAARLLERVALLLLLLRIRQPFYATQRSRRGVV